ALLSVYIHNISGKTEKVSRLVESRTADLRASEAKVKAIVDTVINGIITIDANGAVASFNPAAEKLFGYKADEVLGKNIKMLMPEPFHANHDNYLSKYLLTGQKKVIGIGREVVGMRKDKTVFPVYLAVNEMKIEKERMFVGLIIDITEQKRAEEELMKANKNANILANAAEQASKSKSEFLARMSHEIRTPMNAILGMAELLQETELTVDQKKYIDVFSGAGKTLLLLINDILDLSKIEAGQIELEKIDFDLIKLLNQTVAIMEANAKTKGIELVVETKKDVPAFLKGDPTRLQQVIINLIGNALKFTEKGSVSLSVKNVNNEEPGTLLFAVKDTGVGIPKDKQETIFESFSQADSSVTRKHGGTGLGLAISKKIVEIMGGEICIESEPGKGSVFYFTCKFDVRDKIDHSTGKDKVSKKLPKDGKEAAPDMVKNLPELKILMVEDNSDNRLLALAFLKKTPFKIDIAENGKIAVDKFKANAYDILLMDMQMPVMDGYTATSEIREWEKAQNLKHTPIVALTAHALKSEEQKSLDAGCDGHITKPINKKVLIKTICEHTGNIVLS
ncbi:MAG: ATP-binding protein, partial [Candidatus Anammoxibacter sp.]